MRRGDDEGSCAGVIGADGVCRPVAIMKPLHTVLVVVVVVKVSEPVVASGRPVANGGVWLRASSAYVTPLLMSDRLGDSPLAAPDIVDVPAGAIRCPILANASLIGRCPPRDSGVTVLVRDCVRACLRSRSARVFRTRG